MDYPMFWPPIDPNDPYASGWQGYQRRVLIIVLIWLTFMPAGAFTVGIEYLFPQLKKLLLFNHPIAFSSLVTWIWLAAFISAGCYLFAFPCPRCGQRFHIRRRMIYDPRYGKYCYHCGLPIWWSNEIDDSEHEQFWKTVDEKGLISLCKMDWKKSKAKLLPSAMSPGGGPPIPEVPPAQDSDSKN